MTFLRFIRTDEYKMAAGWNNAVALAFLNPMPRGVSQQVQDGQVRDGMDGSMAEDGFFIDIPYVALDRSELVTVLSNWGLTSVSYALVTVRVPRFDTYANYNGIARRFVTGQTGRRKLNHWSEIIIRVTRLVAI